MARSLSDALGHNSMVNQLLGIMGNAAHVAGSAERNVKSRIAEAEKLNPGDDGFATKVAEARFALGADDGAYLRMNVMPLQTADVGCDGNVMSTPQPEMLRAGQIGVLNAVEEHIRDQRSTAKEKLSDCFKLGGWLLSITEVSDFVNAYFQGLLDAGALTDDLKAARLLALTFNNKAVDDEERVDLSGAVADLTKAGNEEGACELLKILLVLFDVPMATVAEQWEVTLGAEGTGTYKLLDGLDRLTKSVRLLKTAYDTDDAAPALTRPVELRKYTAAAVVVSGFYGPVNFAATSLPEAWAALGRPGGSLTEQAEYNQRRHKMAMDAQAYSSAGKTPAEMEREVLTNRQLAANKEEELATRRVTYGGDGRSISEQRQVRLLVAEVNYLNALADVADRERIFKVLLTEYAKLKSQNGNTAPVEGSEDWSRYLELRELLGRLPDANYDGDLLDPNPVEPRPDEPGPATREVEAARARFVAAAEVWETIQATIIDEEQAEIVRLQREADERAAQASAEVEEAARRAAAALADEQEKARLSKEEQRIAREDAESRARSDAAQKGVESREKNAALAAKEKAFKAEARRRGLTGSEQSERFCELPQGGIVSSSDDGFNALCAGLRQLREDGGVSHSSDGKFERRAGVSPYFPSHVRPLPRASGDRDYWSQRIWPQRPSGADDTLTSLFNRVSVMESENNITVASLLNQDDTSAIAYALARGLCGKPAPHHVAGESNEMRYHIPRAAFPGDFAPSSALASIEEKKTTRSVFGGTKLPPRKDFVDRPYDGPPRLTDALPALWAPVAQEPPQPGGVGVQYTATRYGSRRAAHAAVSSAVVYEAMIDDYNLEAASKEAIGAKSHALLAKACAAAAKIKQLEHMAVVFGQDSLSTLCTPTPTAGSSRDTYHFMTRPVLRCPGGASSVLYPCDAGLAAYVELSPPNPTPLPAEDYALGPGQAYGSIDGFDRTELNQVSRDDMTFQMRSILTEPAPEAPSPDYDISSDVPLYIASPPGINEKQFDLSVDHTPKIRSIVAKDIIFPLQKPSSISFDKLEGMLRQGVQQCEQINRLQIEQDAIERARTQLPDGPDSIDVASRERRVAVWNDAMREACIAGDRLYAFVRQLSGTISEQVDAVCMIDEGMLVRQQQQTREREARLSDRAAQEHMQLVRNVFSTVIRESGLTLGIEQSGGIGQLKVVSNALRKQATELSGGGLSGDGFFANSVRLENLLSKGTGEMTLEQLFVELKDAGRAMKQAADSSYGPGTGTSASTTLDFLSAPRNSLLLRYKPEALSALRQSFDVFQREMMQQHGRLWRTISAYELIEGNDAQLSTAFATFAAHTLVHARMYSSSTAMYVAAWPAAANAQQLKISLQRLVRVACNYLAHSNEPAFAIPTGRVNYFRQQPPPTGGSAPMMSAPRYGVQGGLWGLNMYGNR